MTAVIMAIGVAIPFTPLGRYLGFTRLPLLYWPLLALTLLGTCSHPDGEDVADSACLDVISKSDHSGDARYSALALGEVGSAIVACERREILAGLALGQSLAQSVSANHALVRVSNVYGEHWLCSL